MAVRVDPDEHVNLAVASLLSTGLTVITTNSEQLAQAMGSQAEALTWAAGPGPWIPPAGHPREQHSRTERLGMPDQPGIPRQILSAPDVPVTRAGGVFR